MAGELYAFRSGQSTGSSRPAPNNDFKANGGELVANGDGSLKSDCPDGCCEGAGPEYLLLTPCSACDDNALANTYMIPEGTFNAAFPVVKHDGDCYEVGPKVTDLIVVQPVVTYADCETCCPACDYECTDCAEATATCTHCTCTPTHYTVTFQNVTSCGCNGPSIFRGVQAATLTFLNGEHVLTQNAFNNCVWEKITTGTEYGFDWGVAACTTSQQGGIVIRLTKTNATTFTLEVFDAFSAGTTLYVDTFTVASGSCEGPLNSTNEHLVGDCSNIVLAYGGTAEICPCGPTTDCSSCSSNCDSANPTCTVDWTNSSCPYSPAGGTAVMSKISSCQWSANIGSPFTTVTLSCVSTVWQVGIYDNSRCCERLNEPIALVCDAADGHPTGSADLSVLNVCAEGTPPVGTVNVSFT